MSRDALVAEWVEEARNMGKEHARAGGPTSDDGPLDIIDLNALEAETGEGTSYGELAELQGALETAYAKGRTEGFWESVRQNDKREFDASGKAVVTEEDYGG